MAEVLDGCGEESVLSSSLKLAFCRLMTQEGFGF